MSDANDVSVKDIYKEQYAHFRAMNDILYKIPPLFSVAIGGLWYFAASQLKPIGSSRSPFSFSRPS